MRSPVTAVLRTPHSHMLQSQACRPANYYIERYNLWSIKLFELTQCFPGGRTFQLISIIISCKMNARVIGADRSCACYTLAIMCHHQLCTTTANSKIGFTNYIWCEHDISRLLCFCFQDLLYLLCQSHPGRQK